MFPGVFPYGESDGGVRFARFRPPIRTPVLILRTSQQSCLNSFWFSDESEIHRMPQSIPRTFQLFVVSQQKIFVITNFVLKPIFVVSQIICNHFAPICTLYMSCPKCEMGKWNMQNYAYLQIFIIKLIYYCR